MITDSMNLLVRKVMRTNNLNLCTLFVSRAMELNVTFMMTTSGLEKAGAMCGVRAAARMEKPIETVSPTSIPTAGPTPHSTPTPATLFSSTFVGIITMVLLVGVLRLNPTLATIILPKEKPKTGHLYDILIVVSDEEEAIIENIKHEDIVFLRRIAKCENDQTDAWMMNTSSEPLEARFEVQFYDHFDLLGESGPTEENESTDVGHKVIGNKLITKETYIHEASLHVGMIIRVKPALLLDAHADADDAISCDQASSYSSELDDDLGLDNTMLRKPEVATRISGRFVHTDIKSSKIVVDTDDDTNKNTRCMSNLNSLIYTKNNRSYNDGWSCNDSASASVSGKSENMSRPKNARNSSFESLYSLKDAECRDSSESHGDAEDSMSIELPLDAQSMSQLGSHNFIRNMSARSKTSVGSSKSGKEKDRVKTPQGQAYERKIGSFFSPHHGFVPSPTPPTLISFNPNNINLFDEQRDDTIEGHYLPTPLSGRSMVEKIVFSPERRSAWWNRYTQKQTHKRKVEKSMNSSHSNSNSYRRGSYKANVHEREKEQVQEKEQEPSIDEIYLSKDESS